MGFAFVILASGLTMAQDALTISRPYSRAELDAIFATPAFQEIQREVDAKLAAMPAEKSKFVTDTELALTWGADWRGLAEELKLDEFREAIRALAPSVIMPQRFTPERIKRAKEAEAKRPLREGETQLTVDQVLESFLSTPASKRLAELNRALPGFLGWLWESAFKTRWLVVNELPRESFCTNTQVYGIPQKVVACLLPEGIHLEKAWYESTATSPSSRAPIMLHEMVRYKVLSLASYAPMNQKEQDALTARISVALMDESKSPQEIYRLLERAGFLIDDVNLKGLRTYEVVHAMRLKVYVLENIIKFNGRCANLSQTLDQNLNQNLGRSFETLVNLVYDQIANCRRYALPEIAAEVCETKTLAFHLLDHRQRCTRP